jgi:hypothetical protein
MDFGGFTVYQAALDRLRASVCGFAPKGETQLLH